MEQRVFLRVDGVSKIGITMYYHTSIYVEFEGQKKILISYNENGVRYTIAVSNGL